MKFPLIFSVFFIAVASSIVGYAGYCIILNNKNIITVIESYPRLLTRAVASITDIKKEDIVTDATPGAVYYIAKKICIQKKNIQVVRKVYIKDDNNNIVYSNVKPSILIDANVGCNIYNIQFTVPRYLKKNFTYYRFGTIEVNVNPFITRTIQVEPVKFTVK